MIAEGDPIALSPLAKYKGVRMPNLSLPPGDVAALVEYLKEKDRQPVAPPVGRSTPPQHRSRTSCHASADLAPILHAYVRIQQALHADSIEGIAGEAHAIATEAAKLGTSGTPIASAAASLRQIADITAARSGFGTLSDAIPATRGIALPISDTD